MQEYLTLTGPNVTMWIIIALAFLTWGVAGWLWFTDRSKDKTRQ